MRDDADEIVTRMTASELPEQDTEQEAVKFRRLDDSEHRREHRSRVQDFIEERSGVP